MSKNMGSADRVIRVLLAIVFAVLIFTGTVGGWVAWVLGILGIIFLLTSLVAFCPLYIPFHLSTSKKKE